MGPTKDAVVRYHDAVTYRVDETWHRLLEWTYGQPPSERLAAQILISEGYREVDPSHPLGGRDGGKDALAEKGGKKWVMAAHFPRGQQTLAATKKKFLEDLAGVAANAADALAFVTNQELLLSDRDALKGAAGSVPVELYHLERITTVLDTPAMARVRRQFLGIEVTTTWPDPIRGVRTLEQLAFELESDVPGRVEILARHNDRLIVWIKPSTGPVKARMEEIKALLLATACLLSEVEGVRTLEIGFSDTAELQDSVGADDIGRWRVRFEAADARDVATTKEVEATFWKRATVLLVAGDNVGLWQREVAFDDFEATA